MVCAQSAEERPVAYVHFRWEEEDGVPVLYCYEIQLEAAVQRKGLGKCAFWNGLDDGICLEHCEIRYRQHEPCNVTTRAI